MASSEMPIRSQPNSTLATALKISFCWLVLALAIFQLSENTTDIDLWGHIVFGREMLTTRSIPKAEIYSWTATGQPWISHEVLSECCIGGMHALMGGPGVLLLKLGIGLLAFGLALRMGARTMAWPARYIAWIMGAVAVVEISYGFAARPQIFTALFLVVELWLLYRIHAGRWGWALALPPLFLIWVNTHGGVLAGLGLLGLSAMATTGQTVYRKFSSNIPATVEATPNICAVLWASVLLCGGALFINPWGAGLVRWLVGSVLWLRPEIEEWNPTPMSWDHGALFALAILSAFAWSFTRRQRSWWQLAACAAFIFLGVRSVRNAPLCSFVLLAIVPRHLADALDRFRSRFAGLIDLGRQPGLQKAAVFIFALAGMGIAVATFTLHKEHPLTMEVPAREYPTQAIEFIEKNNLSGKMLAYFDWGEMVLFHLPQCPPSIDGRLDACYSQPLIKAHWKLYNGDPVDQSVLQIDAADLALLPVKLVGTAELAKRPGWKLVYHDETAALLIRDWQRYPQLAAMTLPIEGAKIVGLGRVRFADKCPALAVKLSDGRILPIKMVGL